MAWWAHCRKASLSRVWGKFWPGLGQAWARYGFLEGKQV